MVSVRIKPVLVLMFGPPGPDYGDDYYMGSGTSCLCKDALQSTHLISSFVLLGSWDIKGGACETDPAGNWRARGSAVVDTRATGSCLSPRKKCSELIITHCLCMSGCVRHGIALHCIDVPVTFSVRPLPDGALGDQQILGVHDSTQNPFLHSLLASLTRIISFVLSLSRMRQTLLP